jgi:diaminohydroxyphosphoribosylaminopyrimidine deaminase/5-amino-6-(5-phosphoribosylamino)uracil reductase
MARCLELADVHRGRTAPNPLVGCVIVGKDGQVLAEGAHAGPGTDHAEIVALKQLGGKAPGATLYVNLEPCKHQGRTPPCAPVVRDSGVARVVIGMKDPIWEHTGGIQILRRARIQVTVGVMEEACKRFNRAFLVFYEANRPAMTLKAAITLDGKIATISGQSKYITGPEARDDVMRLRDQADAVMVGVGTVLADDPWLTARRIGARNPIRIVVDSKLRTPPTAHVLPRRNGPRTIVLAGPEASADHEAALVGQGAEVWRIPAHRNGRLQLWPAMRRFAEAGITSILVEGGGELHAYLLEQRLCDELVIYFAPKVVGGPAKSWVGGKGLASLQSAYKFVFDPDPVALGADLRLTASPAPIPLPQPYDDDEP